MTRLLRPALALAAGITLWAAFPTLSLWWLAPVGVALLTAAVDGAGPRAAAALGLVAGWAFFVPTLSWSGLYVGTLPWAALATLQALYWALMAAVIGYAVPRLRASGHRVLAVLVVPVAWVVQELARSTTPWGGFPWARLAFSQDDGPLLHYAAYGGAPLVTAAVAALGTALLILVRSARLPRLAAAATVAGIPLLGLALVPPTDGTAVPVALVQGNVPRLGLEFNAQRRAVLDNHVLGTEALGWHRGKLALVVWPENSSDIDPLRNADAAAQIRRAVDAVDAPVIVGAILDEPSGHHSNVSLLYRPGADGPERYTKNHPVPFAEYVPLKDFFRIFSRYVDATANLVAGQGLATWHLTAPDGTEFSALPSICFEVAYDDLMRDIATQPGAGRSLLVVGTNNATFGLSAESEQQLAISRLRAVEHGRSVLHVSTVGVSAIIAPDGSLSGQTRLFTAAQVLGAPVVRDEVTVSDRLGDTPVWLATLTLAGLLLLAHRSRRPVKVEPSTPPRPRSSSRA